ncbi:MAG: hypothetical protein PHH75_05250 [Candidatus Omnitrophica bacterium]|nr:hypothetical protein [Candidatus Omnitrophota bacterium]MDD5574569.1 hypothetical protein [Candidatus Omnitrophota bacterium]
MSQRIIFLMFCAWLCFSGAAAPADDPAAAPSIETLKTAVTAGDPQGLENLKSVVAWYVGDGKFDELTVYLTSLLKKGFERLPDVYFYRAYGRQVQLDSWKKTKNWEGVYDKGPEMKTAMEKDLAQAEKFVQGRPDMALRIAILRWTVASQDDPEAASGLFDDVVNKARSAATQPDTMALIKKMADALSTYEDKNLARRLYEVYASALKASGPKPEQLKKAGQDFAQQKNIYLAKTLFEGYLEQFAGDPEVLAKETVLVADKFAHQGYEEALDPVYAESLYQKAFDLAGQKAFTSSSQYSRAFNLERMKEYIPAFEAYGRFLEAYPQESRRREVEFRRGVLAAYAKKDTASALEIFLRLKDESVLDRNGLSSLYQLGLLNQWQENKEAAKGFYGVLLDSVTQGGLDPQKDGLAVLARERLAEIEENKEMKYGLRLFLEGIFRAPASPAGVDLTARPAVAAAFKSVSLIVTTSNPQTGCMTPQLAYEWSGEMGSLQNIPNVAELTTDYALPGIRVVHVAVLGQNGPEGVSFEMVQIENSIKESEYQHVEEKDQGRDGKEGI